MGDLKLNGATSGTITLTPAAVAGTNTITLPATTGTLALTASPTFSGTLTATTITSPAATALTLQSAGTNGAIIDTSQNLQFNSGYGSVATAYGCRAWVNFDGSTASPSTRRGSGNVSSVTKNGTGDYTLNFSSAFPDANYAVVFGCGSTSTGSPNAIGTIYNTAGALTTTTARIWMGASNSAAVQDWTQVTCSIFR